MKYEIIVFSIFRRDAMILKVTLLVLKCDLFSSDILSGLVAHQTKSGNQDLFSFSSL